MEHLTRSFLPQPLPILISHIVLGRQGCLAGKDGGDRDGLEFEEGEGGGEEGDADEDEGWVGDVEDVFVQVVDLRSVGDEDRAVCFVDGSGVAVILLQEGERHVVSGAEYYTVEIGEFSAVFEDDSPRYWVESIL